MERAGFPPDGTENAPLQTGLALGDAINPAEDGASQQDVHPGVQDLVAGGHADPRDHQPPVGGPVAAQGSTVGAQSGHEPKDLRGREGGRRRLVMFVQRGLSDLISVWAKKSKMEKLGGVFTFTDTYKNKPTDRI